MKHLFWAWIVLIVMITPLSAQDTVCPDAITNANAACTLFDSNSACLAGGRVSAIQDCENPANFANAGDVISLEGICSLHLGARMSPPEWGLAVLNIGGDDGAASPATMIISGDVDLQNAASVRQTQTVHLTADVSVRRGPGLQFDEVATFNAQDEVDIDACNCTGNWVRLLLDDGQSGWILSRYIEEQNVLATLPVRDMFSPVYDTMQAFRLSSGGDDLACMRDGVLIQTRADQDGAYPMEVNGTALELNAATVFIQAPTNGDLVLAVLDGVIIADIADVPHRLSGGMQGIIQTNDGISDLRVTPLTMDTLDGVPLALLPDAVSFDAILNNPIPQIISAPDCRILSNRGDTLCQLDFVNADGDAIERANVALVYAPEGEWTGSVHEQPALLAGDTVNGTLALPQSCSVGAAGVIIGPVEWSITLEDADGNLSSPFTAYSYCVGE